MISHERKKTESLRHAEKIFDLKEQTAVIIGGAGQMGQRFAQTLGLAGAHVAIADKDGDKCRLLAAEISSKSGAKIIGHPLDVNEPDQIKNVFERIDREQGRIDILIYNVMSKPKGYYKTFDEYPHTAWKEVLDSNLTGAFLCCREVAKYMQKAQSGVIVLTSSIYGLVGPDQGLYAGCTTLDNIYGGSDPLNCPASYSVSKAGLIGLAKYLATLWGQHNIRVNVLVPGGVFAGHDPAFVKEYEKRTPLKRMADWSDFYGAILFLTSHASRYMTGANLVVDGGWTAW